MREGGLVAWQWKLYPDGHATRANLIIHITTVPLFWAGTAVTLRAAGLEVETIAKVTEAGDGEPTVVDLIRRRRCDLVVNTPQGSGARADGYLIREAEGLKASAQARQRTA